jgi:hypothetical protein
LRERAPILEDDQLDRWYLTGFENVRSVLRDKDMSSDPYKARPGSYMARIAAAQTLPREQTFIASMLPSKARGSAASFRDCCWSGLE